MMKEMLQEIYIEASEAALKIRADYFNLEAELKEIKKEMCELADKGAHQEAIVYLALEAGAVDTEGWRDNREEGEDYDDDENEDYPEDDEDDEDEDEDDEDDEDNWADPEYPECSKYDCEECPRNNDCSRW